jgi:hypothetical protein
VLAELLAFLFASISGELEQALNTAAVAATALIRIIFFTFLSMSGRFPPTPRSGEVSIVNQWVMIARIIPKRSLPVF